MSLLRDLEQRLESLFEGFFAKQFKSGVQPVEMAKKLVREMDNNRTISVSKLYVPNHYTILISEADAERIAQFEKNLVGEFQSFLISHAKKEGYDLVGRPLIEFESTPRLSLGEIIITSALESREAEPVETIERTRVVLPQRSTQPTRKAYLVRFSDHGETRIELAGHTTRIGRSADNHIVVPDPNVSRHHAQIESTAAGFVLRDLESTNGTLVNGAKVAEHALRVGDTVAIGTTKFAFRREPGV